MVRNTRLVRQPAGLAPTVWDVVCLAAMSALDFGRLLCLGLWR